MDAGIITANKLDLELYVEMIKEYNQRFNLISAKDLPIIWQRHILDSLQLNPLLYLGKSLDNDHVRVSNFKKNAALLNKAENIKRKGGIESKQQTSKKSSKQRSLTILDIGSGAGFPAIPLAITNHDHKFYLIEGAKKKADFLRNVSRVTKLTNCWVINQRLENYIVNKKKQAKLGSIKSAETNKRSNELSIFEATNSNNKDIKQNNYITGIYPTSFDIITARAFGSLKEIVSLTLPLLQKKTRYILPKGANYHNDLDKLKSYLAGLNKNIYSNKINIVTSLTESKSKIIILEINK